MAGERKKKYGRGAGECKMCGRKQGLVRRYHIMFCRQCFREWARKMGFKKMS
jgi:small subunit ribosomal protein S14